MPGDSVNPALPAAPVNLQTSNTPGILRALPALIAVLASALVALSVTGTAAAATPCGQKVLADWFDNGRVDRLYPPHCYEDAIDAIPRDIGPYSDAEEVITRALQSSLLGKLAAGGRDPTPGDDDPKAPGPKPNDPTDPTDPRAAPDVNTSGPSSVPIPLIVLGGMSLALLAAGGLGYLSRRRLAADADEFGEDDTLQ